MPLGEIAEIYGCKTKTLYKYENFDLDSYSCSQHRSKANYDEVNGNLKIEDFKSLPLLSL